MAKEQRDRDAADELIRLRKTPRYCGVERTSFWRMPKIEDCLTKDSQFENHRRLCQRSASRQRPLAIRSRFMSRARLEAENLLLRQQLIVLRRKSPRRVRLEHRSLAVGMAVSAVPVAPGRDHHRPPGDRASLAPTWFPRLLALEIPKSLKQLSAGIWSGIAGHRRKVGRLSCAITLPASLRWTCS
jgi:hypothetical protein